MAKSPAQKFGENMKKIRLEKGMSQGDICRELGLNRANISNVEHGKKILLPVLWARLLKYSA